MKCPRTQFVYILCVGDRKTAQKQKTKIRMSVLDILNAINNYGGVDKWRCLFDSVPLSLSFPCPIFFFPYNKSFDILNLTKDIVLLIQQNIFFFFFSLRLNFVCFRYIFFSSCLPKHSSEGLLRYWLLRRTTFCWFVGRRKKKRIWFYSNIPINLTIELCVKLTS